MPPKSPLDKPSSSHSRRPSGSRRSSSEQSVSKSPKHGIKYSESQGKSKVIKPDSPSTSKISSRPAAEISHSRTSQERRAMEGTHQESRNIQETMESQNERSEEQEGIISWRDNNTGLPFTTSAEEVQRLRLAMDAQIQLSLHRDRLSKQLSEKGDREASNPVRSGLRSRVSPIHEETASPSLEDAFASPVSGLETASTESVKTIRGGLTPGPMAVRTPSYPFPAMRTPSQSYTGHRPFTALSPTVNPSNYAGGTFDGTSQDQVVSGTVTPASTMQFQPSESSEAQVDPNFETPNLYELTLLLNSEPGLEPWWTSVVEIMKTLYQAHRVTLSVPADTTDVENVPWGQKATFNATEEDELSLTYLPRGSSLVPSSVDTNETSNSGDTSFADEFPGMSTPMLAVRPGLMSRHSFTAYEDTKRAPVLSSEANRVPVAARPTPLVRAQSYLSTRPNLPPRSATLQNAELNLQNMEDHLAFEGAKKSAWEDPERGSRESRGQVFPVLQALDYEAEPLIDNKGVSRVLNRGKVIALTRDYPYVDNPAEEKSGGSKSSAKSKESTEDRLKRSKAPDLNSRISSFFGGKSRARRTQSHVSDKGKSMPSSRRSLDLLDEHPTLPQPRYEEYEQAPPSPWSQSPAPSPAVRPETSENPFFANISAPVDEETFNPRTSTQDYSDMQPETIGADRSWTVLHIPLIHPLLSKPIQSFRLDTVAMESRTTRGKSKSKNVEDKGKGKEKEEKNTKPIPIAILSILSPVIPYPSSLRHSLQHLSSHLATSFNLSRHYSNLETELAGLSRKRPHTTGFGAVAPGGRPTEDAKYFGNRTHSPAEESGPTHSTRGSITSPSDYSGVSRSAGSPSETPGGDPSNVGLSMDKRSSGGSPSYVSGESYFSHRNRPGLGRVDTGSASSVTGARRTSNQSFPADSRLQHVPLPSEDRGQDAEVPSNHQVETPLKELRETEEPGSATSTPRQEPRTDRVSRHLQTEASEALEASPSRQISGHEPRSSRKETPEAREISPARHNTESPQSPRRVVLRAASVQSTARPPHTQLHSYGADFGATFQSLPTTGMPLTAPAIPKSYARSGSLLTSTPEYMPPPSDRVKSLMLDSLPMHIFIALPKTGEIVWVNSRYLSYRGQDVQGLHNDPWVTIHPDERDAYLKAWSESIRTGAQFSMQVRLRRFDHTYRWFATSAIGLKDTRGVLVQWYGTHMDIHDQHIAEVKAARQEEIEASEAKHKQLANLIPQIIFSATEDEGVTFANEQWLSYTGQTFEDALGLGFMDYVHPEDLARCHIPFNAPPTPSAAGPKKPAEPSRNPSQTSSGGKSSNNSGHSEARTESTVRVHSETTIRGKYESLSRTNSSSNGSIYEYPSADLSELTRTGVVKVDRDSNGRVSYSTEVRLRSKSGEYRWHLVRCVEVDNINLGSGDGSWFGACADINDHKLLEMKLKEAMESKSKFLSNMSHEIRTPLIGISGMINFLQDTPLNDEQIDYCSTIASSADGLLNIINDILDLAKADAGMMKLSYGWFHTRSLVEEVNEMVSTIAITKHLEVNYVVDPDVPEMIKGDRFRIRQVLLNVIGNAIKFTAKGEVFSRCTVKTEDSDLLADNEIMLEFEIVDTGRGFTQEEADMIFKPFSQIDGSSTRTHGGTGLGLVISRQFVELHGGMMQGTAVPGKGSTFTFTAKFGVPVPGDHPEPQLTPALTKVTSAQSSVNSSISETNRRPTRSHTGSSSQVSRTLHSPTGESPQAESILTDSPAVLSSGSSAPSVRSAKSQATGKSSVSSVGGSLARFGEAARSGSVDPLSMKLALPDRLSPPPGSPPLQGPTPTPQTASNSGTISLQSATPTEAKHFRPPMFSILLICPQTHSREATTQHIEMTLPKDIPHQITGIASVEEAKEMISGEDPVLFTHIVLNLGSPEEIVALIDQIVASISLPQTSIVVLSDPVQRQEVMKLATVYDYDQLAKDNRVTFIYKPVKPSRFAVIFDPEKERDLSTDRNRFSAQQQVANQRQNYVDVSKRLGNKGHRVLLVEDNATNQKVLLKFLSKIGINVDLALDGVECTDKVFAQPHSFYSLILCDLHMPNKDGYQACQEIREWERKARHPRMPIIALSANVMSDVLDRCIAAGFSNYITKPVDFKALSTVMGDLLDPVEPEKPGNMNPTS